MDTTQEAPGQVKIYTPTPTIARCMRSEAIFKLLVSGRGEGKCSLVGTMVLMHDGTRVPIETVRRGEHVMGPDGGPRTVLELHRGEDEMFEIVPNKGEPFTVTGDHLVSLARTPSRMRGRPMYFEMPLLELKQQSTHFFTQHFLYRVGVDFPSFPVPIEPYWVGLWLGDGHATQTSITTADPEIIDYVRYMADVWQVRFRLAARTSKAFVAHLVGEARKPHRLLQAMRQLGLIPPSARWIGPDTKRIPRRYLYNSRAVRLEVLAGLIDSDGWTNHGGYQIIQKREGLADDIVYLARSLGFAAYKASSMRQIRSLGFEGEYWRVGITGDCSEIPVKLPHKRVHTRIADWKNPLRDGIKEIRPVGRGEYAGFTLDGDGRFLLGDFTVTHNSSGSLMTIITHAQKQDPARWPLKFAALRDTRRNLGLTTAATIKEWFPEGLASFFVGKDLEPEYAQIRLHKDHKPVVEFFFFGCDNPRDYSKFQSFECDGVWMEEPAPAADISGGIPGDALAIAVTSMRKSANPLVIIAENPPDGSDWTAQTWNLPGCEPTDWDLERQDAIERIRAQSEVFLIPKGENYHLDLKTPGYRERNRDMLLALGRADLVARLVEGQVGNVKIGEPVASNFRPEHIVDILPPVQSGERLISSWDPQHSPACILWRVRPGGFADVVAAFQGVNMGVRQLIERTIRPWLALYAPDDVTFIHTGDPNTTNQDQSNSAMSAAKAIIELLGSDQWVPGPASIEDRRLPLHDVLGRYHNGRPWVRIDRRHAKVLIQALQGGWHYGKDTTGRIIKTNWIKSQSSDVGEAFAYGCALLTRREVAESSQEKWRRKVSQTLRTSRLAVVRGTGA